MTSLPITVVTVTHNSEADLKHFWTSDLSDVIRWVVVDNASSDNSAATARSLGAHVIRLPRNVGFSAANNIGAASFPNECFLFANPDVQIVLSDLVGICGKALREEALIAPQLMNADGTSQENGRSDPFLLNKIAHYTGLEASKLNYEIRPHRGETVEVSWVMGAAVCIPKSVFYKIDGWDSKFFLYYEDADISIRARQNGVRTFLDGNFQWTHGWARATRRQLSRRHLEFEARSAVRFYRRYPSLLGPLKTGEPGALFYPWLPL